MDRDKAGRPRAHVPHKRPRTPINTQFNPNNRIRRLPLGTCTDKGAWPGRPVPHTDGVLSRPLIVAIASVAVVAPGCGGNDVSEEEQDRAIGLAKQAYEEAVAEGEDLDVGPCIAEELPGMPDWVADIAHDPRVDIDDKPENQCQRYREGEASHFVELTPEGELIRAE